MDPRNFVGGKETPHLIDTTTTENIIYLGYPVDKSNPKQDAEVWAIQRIKTSDPITIGEWKGGTKEKKFKWSEKTAGTYRGIR